MMSGPIIDFEKEKNSPFVIDANISREENSNSTESAVDRYSTSVDERALVRKLDWTLLPLFTLIYCTNFIDRTAIGNAKIAGLEKDLGMVGFDYNIALTIFYIFYIVFDVPSNIALKQFGSTWLAGMVTLFGIVTIGTAFVQSYAGLIGTRVALGICESGTVSGLAYILSRYYRRSEYVMRVGIFFGLAPTLAGAFGGLLASGLLSINDIGSIHSWRKIFLVEGIITTAFGLLCFFIVPADPQVTRLLSEDERRMALGRIDKDTVTAASTGGKREKTRLELVRRAVNFNTLLCSVCYLFINIAFQGLSLFLPTVVVTLGHFTTVQSQLRTVPPYLVGGAWALISAYQGYRTNLRSVPIITSLLLMVVGYGIFVGTEDGHARYAACFLAIAGASPTGPMFLTWAVDNAAPDTVRATTAGIVPAIGALGAIIAVWTYLPEDAPNYHHGNSLNLAMGCTTIVLTAVGGLYARWENAKREKGGRDYRLEGRSEEEIGELGSLHPGYRYQV